MYWHITLASWLCVVIFCDNAGADVLSMVLLARQLLRCVEAAVQTNTTMGHPILKQHITIFQRNFWCGRYVIII